MIFHCYRDTISIYLNREIPFEIWVPFYLIIITMCEYCGSLDYALTNHDFAIPMQQI